MTAPYFLSPAAQTEVHQILDWTEVHFGTTMADRYESLIKRAILDVVRSPNCRESVDRSEFLDGLRSYHIRYSRLRIKPKKDIVQHPRHVLYYRVLTSGVVEILRIFHDAMDPATNLQPPGDT